jgi:hypothetical protein
VLQLQHRLNPGFLDFESRNSPLLSSQIPISERLQTFCFFHVFFKTGSLPFDKNGLDQTHLFANPNLELSQVQVQASFSKNLDWKDSEHTNVVGNNSDVVYY